MEWNISISHKELHDFNTVLWDNLIYAITIMAIYFVPFLFLFNSTLFSFKKLLKNKIFLSSILSILFFIICLEFYYVRPEFEFHSNFDGGGAIRKLLFLIFDSSGNQKFFLFITTLLLWPIICIFINKNNFYIILYFLIISLFIYPLYQETFDPILMILIVFFS